MISKSFIKSSLIYTLAGALPMASAVILLPFYIHHLSTESFGALTIYLAFAILVQILVTFSFDASVFVHFHEYRKTPKILSSFISSAFVLMVFIGGIVLLISLIAGPFLLQLLFKSGNIDFMPYGVFSVLIGILQALFKVYTSLLQTRQQPVLYFRSNLLSFSLIAVLTIVGLQLYPNSLIGPLGGRMFAALVSGGWAMYRIGTEFGFHFNTHLLRSSFSFNFYSFIYQLQQWLMNYFDRILISFFLPLSEVGIYGFMMSCLMVIEFMINGLYNSFSPKIVGIVTDQDEKKSTVEINRYYHGLTATSMLLVSFSILAFPVIISFINKEDYQRAIPYIPFAILIYLFRSMRLYFGIPYGILKYTKPLPVIYLIVVSIKIVLLMLLIKPLGIYGVIVASIISFCGEILLLYFNGKDRFQFHFNLYKIVLAPIVLLSVIVICELLSDSRFDIYIHAFYVVACIALLAWSFRNEIKLFRPLKILRS